MCYGLRSNCPFRTKIRSQSSQPMSIPVSALSRPIPGRGVHGDVRVCAAAAEAAQQCSGASAAGPQPQEALRGPVCPSAASTRTPGDGALAGATPRLQVPREWQPKYPLRLGSLFFRSIFFGHSEILFRSRQQSINQ